MMHAMTTAANLCDVIDIDIVNCVKCTAACACAGGKTGSMSAKDWNNWIAGMFRQQMLCV